MSSSGSISSPDTGSIHPLAKVPGSARLAIIERALAMSAGMAASPRQRPPSGPLSFPGGDADRMIEQLDALGVLMGKARKAVSGVIFGQDTVVEQTLITVLSGGHALLIGVPGLGKSRLVETMGVVLGLDTKRVQFTPDLMPADIIGGEVLDDVDGRRSFRFVPGPVFCQLLMADEINRASPRTQSALLQSMQEQRVAIAGVEHRLPRPFHVLATQNPIEQEGTYPLPEAQLDRFLLAIDISYPDLAAERAMLLATTGAETQGASAVMTPEELIDAQNMIRRMPIGEAVVDAILAMVRGGRPESTDLELVRHHVAWGPGPRAAQALMLACRARAILDGRLMPSLDDVSALAGPVLRHRMALNFSARADGIVLDEVIGRLVERLG
jgi:MoxR-like ATPase